jgi:hypothetical protein
VVRVRVAEHVVPLGVAIGLSASGRITANSVSSPEPQGENEMAKIEQLELDGHRSEIIADVKRLVEKYRAIFDWDVPDIDQNVADKLILVEMRKALDDIEKELLG